MTADMGYKCKLKLKLKINQDENHTGACIVVTGKLLASNHYAGLLCETMMHFVAVYCVNFLRPVVLLHRGISAHLNCCDTPQRWTTSSLPVNVYSFSSFSTTLSKKRWR